MMTRALAVLLLALAARAGIAQRPDTTGLRFGKDPASAALFSVVIPGSGQFYAGKPGKAAQILGGIAIATAMTIHFANSEVACTNGPSTTCDATRSSNTTMLTFSVLSIAGFWTWGILTAPDDVREYNRKHGLSTPTIYERERQRP